MPGWVPRAVAHRRPLTGARGSGLRRRTPEQGSVLILMPACVLVVLVLASIAVDMSLVHLRQRQALDVAAAAANDAVTAGVDPVGLRAGSYDLDPVAVTAVAERAAAESRIGDLMVGSPAVALDGEAVEVTLVVEVQHLFSGIMPGVPRSTTVTASASAVSHEL